MKKILVILLFVASAMVSCKKESEKKYCWQGYAPSVGVVHGLIICDKTASEVRAAYPDFWFYKSDEPIYCWLGRNSSGEALYSRNIPASIIDSFKIYGSSYNKIDCNSFCRWTWLERTKSKITGFYAPTKIGTEVYMPDSCSKIFVGRVIVIKETSDTIHLIEFQKEEEF